MKKFTTYFLIIQIATIGLFDGGLLGELFRIPYMLEHFGEHQRESNGEMSLLEFLALHYFNEEHVNSDPQHHNNLPFTHSSVHSVLQFVAVVNSIEFEPTATIAERPYCLFKENLSRRSVFLSVFHPPDQC